VFGTAKFKPNKIPSLKKNAFYGQYNNTKFSEKSFFLEFVHSRQLSPPPEKCQLSSRYLVPTSVGRKISGLPQVRLALFHFRLAPLRFGLE
jgi:hypothetical protein